MQAKPTPGPALIAKRRHDDNPSPVTLTESDCANWSPWSFEFPDDGPRLMVYVTGSTKRDRRYLFQRATAE